MALDTYDGLKDAIAGHLVVGDVTDRIDDFIDLCEARNQQALHLPDRQTVGPVRLRAMLTRHPITVAARYVDVPSDLVEAESFRLLTTPVTDLEQVSLAHLTEKRRETQRRPCVFSLHEQFEFDVEPDQSYSGELFYYKALTPLSDNTANNALLAQAPNVYLYGALAASAPFLLHDERVPLWEQLYINARIGLAGAERRQRQAGPQVARLKRRVP